MSKLKDISSANLWQELKNHPTSKWALRCTLVLFFIALFANFIANDRPLYCKVEGKTYYPVFNQIASNLGFSSIKTPKPGASWHDFSYETAIWPVIPFASQSLDLENKYKAPFTGAKKNNRFRHILGTGLLGKDIAAGLVHGTRLALSIGILSILLAALIGIFIGGIAGYFGDHSFRLSWLSILGLCLGILVTIYYTKIFFEVWSIDDASIFASTITFIGSLLCAFAMGSFLFILFYFIGKWARIPSSTALPLDLLLMRLIEIIQSIPALLILLVLAGIFSNRSIWIIIFIIAFIKWTGIAKFIRAELLQIRHLPYIESARASGLGEFRILLKHAIPNAMTPIYIAMAFGMASAILLEATISFLGIGVEQEIMSWGKMLAQARQKPSAWWLAIFPGMLIFVCVVVFNLIGDQLSKVYKGHT
jgi:peptide/nickel transport system permease protein